MRDRRLDAMLMGLQENLCALGKVDILPLQEEIHIIGVVEPVFIHSFSTNSFGILVVRITEEVITSLVPICAGIHYRRVMRMDHPIGV
jgi:hypothetical protein